jgi:hypothetical protein
MSKGQKRKASAEAAVTTTTADDEAGPSGASEPLSAVVYIG